METLRRRCATVPQPSELRFGVVHAVGRGIAVLDGGPRRANGRGSFGGVCSPFSEQEMPLGQVNKILMQNALAALNINLL